MNFNRIEMKWDVWLLAAIVSVVLLVAILISCSDNVDGLSPYKDLAVVAGWGPDVEISSETASHSGCKSFDAAFASNDIPPTRSVVTWEYDGAGVLNIHHFNAALNCCPISYGEINVENRTITVMQADDGMCACLCLFDIDYRITGLPPGRYLLQFDEELLCEVDEPLASEITLKGTGASGELTAARSCYPWGFLFPVTGELVANSDCGGFDTDYLSAPPDFNCLIWEYDDSGTLNLYHQNAVFNCCPEELIADIRFGNDTIYVEESEDLGEIGGCDCLCPYDLDMVVHNLPSGTYTIALSGQYIEDPVIFDIDLVSDPSGYHCWEEAIEDPTQ